MFPRNPLLLGLVVVLLAVSAAPAGDRVSDQQTLKPFARLVGPWKGTGQPQRGSARGAWRESAEWAWVLTPETAALRMTTNDGKYVKSIMLRPGGAEDRFAADVVLADGSRRTFSGKAGPRDVLPLEPGEPPAVGLARITLTPLHENRFLVLLEGRDGEAGPVRRLAEVGYTRQGVAFAAGDSYPTCIVTEGRGTIRVSFQGREYWVCCSGCKELFDEDPAGIIAEAEARKREQSAQDKP
jgi:YHS domain-containing protein